MLFPVKHWAANVNKLMVLVWMKERDVLDITLAAKKEIFHPGDILANIAAGRRAAVLLHYFIVNNDFFVFLFYVFSFLLKDLILNYS